MGLFGPKAPCPHCGRKVRKRDATEFLCPHCGQPGPWATPEQARDWEAERQEQIRAEKLRAEARARCEQLLAQVSTGALAPSGITDLAQLERQAEYSPDELKEVSLDAWLKYVSLAVSDDIVTPEEYSHINSLVEALGLTEDDIAAVDLAILDHLMIASVNGGVLPEIDEPTLMAKRGEVVHFEWPAELMKEVTHREFRAGYQGFSFPIGKTGIRYRVGGARGHSVVTGTELQVADSGSLSVSSKRAVFIGTRKTIELPYSKLVNLTVYRDGLQFHQSNRQTAPLFRLRSGEVVAAVVNAAAHRLS
jgi:hypothetical protein